MVDLRCMTMAAKVQVHFSAYMLIRPAPQTIL